MAPRSNHERLNQKRHAWAGARFTPITAPTWRPSPRDKIAESIVIARADLADLERHYQRRPTADLERMIAERKERLASLLQRSESPTK